MHLQLESCLVNEKEVDILLLAEVDDQTVLDFIVKQIKCNPSRQFYSISDSKVFILSIYNPSIFHEIKTKNNHPRWSVFTIEFPTMIKINLFCVHFHSKLNWSDDSLTLECVNLAREIEEIENRSEIFDSIVIGDFNMNPYESGMVAANGLHALPDLNHVNLKPDGRKIDGIKYRYFYNPMWNFFGDNTIPYGTHYYREAGHVSKEWNIYDQIIYRPSLSKYTNEKSTEIIHKIGSDNLITTMNRPDSAKFSDHLPIIIELNI